MQDWKLNLRYRLKNVAAHNFVLGPKICFFRSICVESQISFTFLKELVIMRYSYGVKAQLEWLSMFACRGAGAKLSGMTSHQE